MQNPNPLRRRLSLFGLLIILVAFMWLAVQAVQLFPSAASNLASLANSVYNYNPRAVQDFSVTGPTSMVTSGNVFNLSWPNLNVPGQYSFSYSCNPGVTASIRTASQTFAEAECDTNYNIGEVNQVEIALSSNQARFAEVDYTISFFRTNATTPTAVASGGLTIINPTLSLSGEPMPTPDESVTRPSAVATTTVTPPTRPTTPSAPVVVDSTLDRATTTPPVTAPTTPGQAPAGGSTNVPAPTTPPRTTVTPRPAPTITYTYALPVSRPDGFTDLAVSYLGVGTFNQTGQFINTGRLQVFTVGAIQFSVHNLGTRTSETWRYTAVLPNGQTYTSPDQVALKPNERATITLGFPVISNNPELSQFRVSIETTRDTSAVNNGFTWSTLIVR